MLDRLHNSRSPYKPTIYYDEEHDNGSWLET